MKITTYRNRKKKIEFYCLLQEVKVTLKESALKQLQKNLNYTNQTERHLTEFLKIL